MENLHQQFVEYGKNARKWMHKCRLLLLDIARLRIWEKHGFSSIYVYAAKVAGMSERLVDETLWILRALEELPCLRKVAEDLGLSRVRPVIGIVDVDSDKFWAEKARGMGNNVLKQYVAEYRKLGISEVGLIDFKNSVELRGAPRLGFKTAAVSIPSESLPFIKTLLIDIELDVYARLSKLREGATWNIVMSEFLRLRDCDLLIDKPDVVEAGSRKVPVAIARYVLRRSNEVCEFGDCLRDYDVLHHVDRFGLLQVHDPERIVALCQAHHEVVHQGLVDNENDPAWKWRVREEADSGSAKSRIDELFRQHQQKLI